MKVTGFLKISVTSNVGQNKTSVTCSSPFRSTWILEIRAHRPDPRSVAVKTDPIQLK